LNIVKNQSIILKQIDNSQVVTTSQFWTDYGKNKCYFHWTLHSWKGTLLSALKGNNSCKTYNFRIKVGNVQMVYWCNCWPSLYNFVFIRQGSHYRVIKTKESPCPWQKMSLFNRTDFVYAQMCFATQSHAVIKNSCFFISRKTIKKFVHISYKTNIFFFKDSIKTHYCSEDAKK
jgi:hypothetical protein